MPTLTLIDGSGFIFRAYHALPSFTNAAGQPVGAVMGFTNMMLKLLDSHTADHIAVVFDASRKTFRNRIYGQYKAHRPPLPEDLIPQFALVREAVDALGVARVEMEDYEADDIIASYAKAAKAAGMEVVVVSSDKDLMQLVCEGIAMHDPMKNKPIGPAEVREKFGVEPCRVRDVLAMIGDSSDNIPGVPGIGPKTAAELINQFGNLESLLSRLAEIKQPKRREVLEQHAENARLSYKLIGLEEDVPLPLPLEQLAVRNVVPETLQNFLTQYGFKNILARLKDKMGFTDTAPIPAATSHEPRAASHDQPPFTGYELVTDAATLSRWVAEARHQGVVAIDTETTALDATQAKLVGFSLALAPGRACYVPVGHRLPSSSCGTPQAGAQDLFAEAQDPAQAQSVSQDDIKQIPLPEAIAILKPLLADESVLKIGQNLKYDALVLKNYGCETKAFDDTMLMSYALNAGLHGQGMDELSEKYLGHVAITYNSLTGTGKSRICFSEVPPEKALDYAAEDADITFRLWEHFKPQLSREGLLTLYETIERPLIPVIVAMESCGVRVDIQELSSLSGEFAFRMRALEEEVHKLAGHPFNIGSPKQMGEVLFDEMQLPGGRKSGKSGTYGTDAGVLEDLAAQGHDIAVKILEWRQLSKLRGTYTESLMNQLHPETKRVHTSFSLAVTSTGRLSSSEPNLQNIPIRTTEGKKIRHAFIAAEGHALISADYSQIELRLLADMADIPVLKEAFRNREDIHAITAAQMFGCPVDAVSGDLRRKAKTINFGIIYGMSAHGLSVRLGIPRLEAAAYIERYFAQYPGIRDYMERTKNEARQHGYVTTLFGRRCHVPGINDKNPNRRQFSERAAINAPLQGTAADIIKRAMIKVHAELAANLPECRMLLQVHDELLFEVPLGREARALEIIKPAMEGAANLSVPLVVETGVGNNWGEIHG